MNEIQPEGHAMNDKRTGAVVAGRTSAATGGYLVPALASFKVAALHLGASSGAAVRRRFERGIYPKRFLVQLTPRTPGVDLHAVLAWIRHGGADVKEPEPEAAA